MSVGPPVGPTKGTDLPPVRFTAGTTGVKVTGPGGAPPGSYSDRTGLDGRESGPRGFPLLETSVVPVSTKVLDRLWTVD